MSALSLSQPPTNYTVLNTFLPGQGSLQRQSHRGEEDWTPAQPVDAHDSQQFHTLEQGLVPSRLNPFVPQKAQAQESNWNISEQQFIQVLMNTDTQQSNWNISEEQFVQDLMDTQTQQSNWNISEEQFIQDLMNSQTQQSNWNISEEQFIKDIVDSDGPRSA
jgi:hypothetical protein